MVSEFGKCFNPATVSGYNFYYEPTKIILSNPSMNAGAKHEFEIGKGHVLHEGKGVAIVACGIMVEKALAAREMLAEKGIDATVVDMHTIKPIDKDLLVKLAENHELFITCEEHTVVGGLGSAVAECLAANAPRKVKMIGVQDVFGESGTPDELLAKYNMTAEDIVNAVIEG